VKYWIEIEHGKEGVFAAAVRITFFAPFKERDNRCSVIYIFIVDRSREAVMDAIELKGVASFQGCS
jgi:hypothetical protein